MEHTIGGVAINLHKLRFGAYRTPRFKYGATVECEARGEVTIVKLTAASVELSRWHGRPIRRWWKNELQVRMIRAKLVSHLPAFC